MTIWFTRLKVIIKKTEFMNVEGTQKHTVLVDVL